MKYIFSGKVVRGDGYGRVLGYPTINIDRRSYSRLKTKPKMGVHSGKVELSGKVYRAGIIIRPMGKDLPKLEAHIIGYSGNAYGKRAVFIIEKFLRPYKNFKTKEALLAQIRKDLKKCK